MSETCLEIKGNIITYLVKPWMSDRKVPDLRVLFLN